MALISSSPYAITLAVSLSIVWLVWKVVRPFMVKSPLWNVRGPERTSWAAGNLGELYDPSNIQIHYSFIEKYGPAVRIHGPFGSDHLYVTDPLALHHVVVKDEDIFEEPPRLIALNYLGLGPGLLSTLGAHHAKQKRTLNPFFSIKHMRENLMPVFLRVSNELCTIITNKLNAAAETKGKKVLELDILDYMARTALEYIGQGGLGYSFNSYDEDDNGKAKKNRYADAVKELIPVVSTLQLPLQFLHLLTPLINILPFSRATRRQILIQLLSLLPSKNMKKLLSIINIIGDTSKMILDRKREDLANGVGDSEEDSDGRRRRGRDVVSGLLKAEMTQRVEDRIPEDEIIGHMNTLIFTAYETTTSALCRILHLLALHPDVQRRLRGEIWTMMKKLESEGRDVGGLDYDELNGPEMKFLEAVVRETLRVHAPVAFVPRIATRDTILPFSRPLPPKNNTDPPITSLVIPKGVTIQLGICAANRDKKIWGDDADEWKVERFLRDSHGESFVGEGDGGKERLPGIYGGMMTFMGGGRSCIGLKFSQLEIKIVLFTLLSKFTFSPSSQESLVHWEMHNIQSPAVKGKGKGLPLVVGFATEDDI